MKWILFSPSSVKDGYVEFSYELGGGPAIIRSQSRVDDGQFHSLKVERTRKQGVLTLNREAPQVTQSPGEQHMLNANGNIYIGQWCISILCCISKLIC